MKIECKLQRAGGTAVKLDQTNYHFSPLADGAHVADVEIEHHIARFLSIPEGYRVYGIASQVAQPTAFMLADSAPAVQLAAQDEQEPEEVEPILTSVLHPEHVTIGGTVYTVNQFARMGFVKSGLSAEDWNSLTVDTRADFIDEALTELNAAVPEAEDADEGHADDGQTAINAAAERTALVAEYEAKFNKKPHHKLSAEKIRAAIDEA